MLIAASGTCSAATPAVVSGVVRDAQGVAQMGAVVQVLAVSAVSVATAFTDMNGRYRIANLVPGRYQVRATAALFVPATRHNLQLSTGMRATVVDMTPPLRRGARVIVRIGTTGLIEVRMIAMTCSPGRVTIAVPASTIVEAMTWTIHRSMMVGVTLGMTVRVVEETIVTSLNG